jgi:uncharacterized protein YjcR
MSEYSGSPSRSRLHCNRSRNRPHINWPAIEGDYRSGAMSLRDMADKHGCSHSTIANFAGRQGWKRQLPVAALGD